MAVDMSSGKEYLMDIRGTAGQAVHLSDLIKKAINLGVGGCFFDSYL